MPFPDDPLDIAVELKLGDTWVDIKAAGHVFTEDPITITRGRQDEGARADPATCTLTIDNRDGRYSPRNPLGPYYGLIGRNTPLRVVAGCGLVGLVIPPDSLTATATTPDHASLDITGDLDVRVEAHLGWALNSGGLIGKYAEVGNQRSWVLWLEDSGALTLYWSTDGANLLSARSTVPVPAVGRLAVRATIDVNNGAAGRTITFHTAPSIGGTWTQLGATLVQAGTTSIFNSTSPLAVGAALGDSVTGRYVAAELRNGIGGTVVAGPDFSAQPAGTTSFTDGSGRTWTVNGDAQITDRDVRFYGEVPAWPIRWDTSGTNVWVQIEAAGIMRRLGQGAKPLRSALYRAITNLQQQFPATAYWPLEDAPGSTQAASAIPTVAPLRVVGPVSFTGEPSGGTAGGATFDDRGGLYGRTPAPATNDWVIVWWLDLPADMGTDTVSPVVQWRTPGSPIATRWDLYTGQAIGGKLLLEAARDDNTIVISVGGTTDLRGRGPVQVVIVGKDDGTGTGAHVYVDGVNEINDIAVGDLTTPPTTIGVNTNLTPGLQYSGSVSHLLVTNLAAWSLFYTDLMIPAGRGHVGETAGARFVRLTGEEGVPAGLVGDPAGTEPMGPQQPLELLELLGECAEVDAAVLYERRDALGLVMRARAADYNTAPALVLDYHDQLAAPLEPDEDDQGTRNDVTVERSGGSSARVTVDEGPLSTQAPPNGVGIYSEQVTLSVADDDQLLPQAGWRAHLGTVDEARYPVARLKLHKHPELAPDVVAADIRSRIHLTGLPAWEPPGTVDLLADGYTETIETRRWWIEYNTVPGSPWRVAVADDATLGRADTAGSALVNPAASGATGLMVATRKGPYWTTAPAELPMDLRLGGEVVGVTAVADGVNDTFARTVSNGWGSAPGGQAWTVYGTASHYSVGSSIGQVSIPSRNVADVAGLAQPTDGVDMEVTLRTPVAPITGSAIYFYLLANFDRTAFTWYAYRVGLYTDGTVRAQLEKGAPSFTVLAAERVVAGITVTANQWLRARLRIQDGRLYGKTWVDGGTEPEWQLFAFDTSYVSGDVGVQAFLPTANTNTLPVLFQFGDLILHNPQALTVTRAVNGIAKAQAAGTDIRLAQPATIAL
ncbi:hypothetical protein [Actinomadura macra]|uniref:hypothetical protein n=1 Tax=Actinomadura macra TaxID=46164 RepID=UPI000833ED5F|nr:hypothetical protein [Actinomadura macra]